MPCINLCSVSLPYGIVGWSVVCDCAISLSYSLSLPCTDQYMFALDVWTGGNDHDTEDTWVWGYPSGEAMSYTNWGGVEPNNVQYGPTDS